MVDADHCKKSSERNLMKDAKNGGEAANAVPNDEYGVIKFTKKSKKNNILVNLVAETMNLMPRTSEFL
ncbi:MAG: hypothetical protein ACKO96_39635 [Flammeovirgaceae bacterium]